MESEFAPCHSPPTSVTAVTYGVSPPPPPPLHPPPSDAPQSGKSLGAGAAAGIAIGTLAAIGALNNHDRSRVRIAVDTLPLKSIAGLIGAAGFFIWRRKRRSSQAVADPELDGVKDCDPGVVPVVRAMAIPTTTVSERLALAPLGMTRDEYSDIASIPSAYDTRMSSGTMSK